MKVLLVFGGAGSEHDVSLLGARNVVAALSKTGHEIVPAYITQSGAWSVGAPELMDIDGLRRAILGDHLTGSTEKLAVQKAAPIGSTATPSDLSAHKFAGAEVIFPLIHGRGGEDGAIAALGQLLNIPVIGCDVRASQIAWDKDLCKQIVAAAGVPVVPWRTFHRHAKIPSFAKLTAELGSKILFVKPAREGSSVGVSRAASAAEFSAAVEKAFTYDDKILVEKAISGRELECAVLGNTPDVTATDIGEIKPPAGDFYSYDEKYSTDSRTGLDIPAQNLDPLVRAQIQDYSRRAFIAIGGRGLARVDFFLSDSGEIYLNEINTMPGFTNISMYPKLWEQMGLSQIELIERLIELAIADQK